MKAAIQTAYGEADVLQLQSVDQPQAEQNQILVRIKASSVTAADTMMRRGVPRYARLFLGLLKPRIPISGTGFSGVVESVGEDVTLYKVGDDVFGESVLGAGTNTEYVCVPEEGVVALKPHAISHAEAAPVCDGAMTVQYMLNDLGQIKAGDKVLVNGAAGSLGSAAVQIAHSAGAQVVGTCSKRNFEFVRSLGAVDVIDYNDTDVTKTAARYDLIFDSVGKLSHWKSKRILCKTGRFISPGLSLSLLLGMLLSKINGFSSRRVLFAATGLLPEDKRRTLLQELCELLENGRLKTIVDKRYPLSAIVNAHRYIDTGHKRANVVVDMTVTDPEVHRAA